MSRSVTVAVQLVAVLLVTGFGEQLITVEVDRWLTVTEAPPLLLLVLWNESPA